MPAAATIDAAPVPADADLRGLAPNGRPLRLPALDGIRGLGIPFVLLYHHGEPILGIRFGGGFMAVSMFFTLSGFLITRLLIAEYERSSSINLGKFYVRRARRLLPALLAVTLLVAVAWAVYPTPTRTLPFGAYFWTVFYGTNLYLIWAGNSYNNLFADRSPLQHTWSLAIEEQIYLVFPVVLLATLRSARLRRHVTGVLAALAAASFGTGWFWATHAGNTRAYYATEARAGEFLMGAALAALWVTWRAVPALGRWMRSRAGRITGFVLLAAEVVLWWQVDLGTAAFFKGITVLNSVVVCALMAYASSDRDTGVSHMLANRVLVALGQRAYILYLVHWPVFVFVDAAATRLSSIPLLAVRLAITAVISESIHRWLEVPVMESRRWRGSTLAKGCVLLGATGLAIAPFAAKPMINRLLDEDAVELQREALAALPQITAADPTRSAVDPALPARVLVVGDSQSWFVGTGMQKMWGDTDGVRVEPSAGVGCGTAPLTPIRYLGDEFANGRPGCQAWRDALPRILDRFRPQVVVIIGGFADLADHEVDGTWQHIGEPAYDTWLTSAMNAFATEMGSTGARVLWLTHPHVDPPDPPGVDAYPEEDPARMDRYNELITALAARRDDVDTADLATLVEHRPGGEFSTTFRPDGSHMLLTEAADVVQFIAAAITESTRHVR